MVNIQLVVVVQLGPCPIFWEHVQIVSAYCRTSALHPCSHPLLDLGLPLQAVLLHLYNDVLGPYWAKPRRHVDVGYRGIEPTPDDFGLLVRRELETTEVQTVDHLVRAQHTP